MLRQSFLVRVFDYFRAFLDLMDSLAWQTMGNTEMGNIYILLFISPIYSRGLSMMLGLFHFFAV